MSILSAPDKMIVHEPPEARRIHPRELPALMPRNVQVIGIDAPPASLATTAKTLGVVELPEPPSAVPTLAEVIADAVLAKLSATGAVAQVAPTNAKRIVDSNTDSRKPHYVDLAEAAIRLGTTKGAMKKYLARHQRRDGRDTVCVLGAGARAVKVRGRWRVRFDDEGRP